MGEYNWSKTISIISLILLQFTYLLFSVFSGLEFIGRRVLHPGVYLSIFHIVLPIILGITFWCSYSSQLTKEKEKHDRAQQEHSSHPKTLSSFSKKFEKIHMYYYPRYLWDFWTWIFATLFANLVTSVLIIVYFAEFGFQVDPDFSDPIGSPVIDRYHSIVFFSMVFSILSFLFGTHIVFNYIIQTYDIERVDLLKTRPNELDPNITHILDPKKGVQFLLE